uniref:N-acetyllactosaminide beta-1,3-N-acetylglucosaminyltransferase n=1 Tax=Parastrongyloides trichosuri TaxID=131310 RepID=A0A0N4Z762_PARTI
MKIEPNSSRITLVLHLTIDFFKYLEKQIKIWEGPISVALVIPRAEVIKCPNNKIKLCGIYDEKNFIIFKILYYFKKIFNPYKVSLHLLYDNDGINNCVPIIINEIKDNDNLMEKYKKGLELGRKLPSPQKVYPINVARNIARMGKKTELFLSSDIENFSSDKYETKVSKIALKYLLEQKRKIVLVHRRFEYDIGASRPKNKKELKNLYIQKKASMFHASFYMQAHYIPYINQWMAVPEDDNVTSIFMTTNFTKYFWEPQFVGDNRVPYHLEEFPYRIRSNTHLGILMCHQEFRFAILNDVFMAHEGRRKKLNDNEEKSFKKGFNSIKKTIFDFNRWIKSNYPNMKKKCPSFLTA